MNEYGMVVVGAGPAGATCAIYAARAGVKAVVLDDGPVGGMANYTNIIENYPGLSAPVSGMEFGEMLRVQMERFGVERVVERVDILDMESGFPFVRTSRGELRGGVVVIATGCHPKSLGVEGEEKFRGRGVSVCAVCDGPLFKGKEVAVIGGGDSACEEALYLVRFASKVHLVHRRNRLRAVKILQEKVFKNPQIVLHLERVVSRFEGDIKLRRLILCSVDGKKEESLEVEGVFVYAGNEPNTSFIRVELKRDEEGFIVTDEEMRTSVERVYAAGDVRSKLLRQIVTAASDGAIAASSAVRRYLEK